MITKRVMRVIRRALGRIEVRRDVRSGSNGQGKAVTIFLVGDTAGFWGAVSRLASRHDVTGGMAINRVGGVQIQAEADPAHLRAFVAELTDVALSRGIEHVQVQSSHPGGPGGFHKVRLDDGMRAQPSIHELLEPGRLHAAHRRVWSMLSGPTGKRRASDSEWMTRLDLALPREMVPFNFDKRYPDEAVTAGYSYATSMWSRIRFREAMQAQAGTNWEFVLEDKNNGRDFARSLGLPLPELYQSEVALDDVRLEANQVVKPSNGAGARGVFIFMPDGRIKDLRSKTTFRGNDEFLRRARAVIDDGVVSGDAWNVEELVSSDKGGLPNDLKFQCFYGHCPLMAEVKRDGSKAFCWWTPDGEPVDVGSFSGDQFVGAGAEPWLWALAERISRMIPAPFVRIDFLAGGEKIVFGEFTPRPGGFTKYHLEMDRELGRCFVEAEARLFNDLVQGRGDFAAFRELQERSASRHASGSREDISSPAKE